jgi:hypothetical protein
MNGFPISYIFILRYLPSEKIQIVSQQLEDSILKSRQSPKIPAQCRALLNFHYSLGFLRLAQPGYHDKNPRLPKQPGAILPKLQVLYLHILSEQWAAPTP